MAVRIRSAGRAKTASIASGQGSVIADGDVMLHNGWVVERAWGQGEIIINTQVLTAEQLMA